MFGKILAFVFAFIAFGCCSSPNNFEGNKCDTKNLKDCPGPLYLYQEFGCEPVYTDDSCCPSSYRCDESKYSNESRCFLNGVFYNSGQSFPVGEIGDACKMCKCNGGTQRHSCVSPFCARAQPGCYNKLSALDCCPRGQVCPEDGVEIPTCVVDGKTYMLGERFVPLAEPEKKCTCYEGYTGNNVEPFCISRKPGWCGNHVDAINAMRGLCSPTYFDEGSPQSECNWSWIYFDDDDIKKAPFPDSTSTAGDESIASCKLGSKMVPINNTLHLSQPNTPAVRCICEVPPFLTCIRSDMID